MFAPGRGPEWQTFIDGVRNYTQETGQPNLIPNPFLRSPGVTAPGNR